MFFWVKHESETQNHVKDVQNECILPSYFTILFIQQRKKLKQSSFHSPLPLLAVDAKELKAEAEREERPGNEAMDPLALVVVVLTRPL